MLGLENFQYYFTSVWDDCNCVVVWAFFGIVFLWDWNENWPFPVLWPLLSFSASQTVWLTIWLNEDLSPYPSQLNNLIKYNEYSLLVVCKTNPLADNKCKSKKFGNNYLQILEDGPKQKKWTVGLETDSCEKEWHWLHSHVYGFQYEGSLQSAPRGTANSQRASILLPWKPEDRL